MIVLNGEWTTFERSILENIVDVSARDLRFENIHFACDSITDAGGRVFARERTCHNTEQGCTELRTGMPVFTCSECEEIYVIDSRVYFCPSCGAKVVEE